MGSAIGPLMGGMTLGVLEEVVGGLQAKKTTKEMDTVMVYPAGSQVLELEMGQRGGADSLAPGLNGPESVVRSRMLSLSWI